MINYRFFIFTGVSPNVEARNVKLCCFCQKDEDCKSFCKTPPYRCALNICACSKDLSPKIELQKLMRAQIEESRLHGPNIKIEQ